MPVQLGRRVERLSRVGGLFEIEAAGQLTVSRAVIAAAGAFQIPARPRFAGSLPSDVLQLDCGSYRNPAAIPEGRVLVVGSGATGRQIARQLCESHETWIARGRPVRISPHRILGKDVMWWTKTAGILEADKASWRGRIARRFDAFPGLEFSDRSLKRAGIHLVGRAIGANGNKIHFSSGEELQTPALVWATGYCDDTSWIRIDGALDHGAILENRGVSPVPGLYYLGRSWQKSRASALLCGVGTEAKEIVSHLRAYLDRSGSR